MNLKARTIASVLFLSSSVFACFLFFDAWDSRSSISLFVAATLTLQGAFLLGLALGRKLNRGFCAAFLCWCLLSGVALPLMTVGYARNHGVSGWVAAAGASGVIDESGQFYSSTPPVSPAQLTITILFSAVQMVSAFIFWRTRSSKAENAEPHSA